MTGSTDAEYWVLRDVAPAARPSWFGTAGPRVSEPYWRWGCEIFRRPWQMLAAACGAGLAFGGVVGVLLLLIPSGVLPITIPPVAALVAFLPVAVAFWVHSFVVMRKFLPRALPARRA